MVETTVTMMRGVTESVDLAARQIAGLGQRSKQIGEIVNVIDEIAGRTNLLALNAAIEAAGAGGKDEDFAVVAGGDPGFSRTDDGSHKRDRSND